ncbi:hypothetical protein ACMT1E_04435 [Sphingomonas flavalba]|uniref:hypothetical protein n=1 Tax=Sphingomonas flavalba TaxID=2559804 RepID=UPI0039E052CA
MSEPIPRWQVEQEGATNVIYTQRVPDHVEHMPEIGDVLVGHADCMVAGTFEQNGRCDRRIAIWLARRAPGVGHGLIIALPPDEARALCAVVMEEVLAMEADAGAQAARVLARAAPRRVRLPACSLTADRRIATAIVIGCLIALVVAAVTP